ncbi:hypothetical protein [Rivularia sp. UHCC 0363]|uniref:hypothetical protein n=1 Tax=Rivularia sp. UHCC 0363 TaxID=3110244 RepID=UPI002B1FBCE9|nr:hypothetical protein [Rivularia sp. UHCC 0363]MEA5599218.1 hypothetical protein [Rivularia sp. UHCC 0363]
MNKFIKYIVILAFSTPILVGCSGDGDTSTVNSSPEPTASDLSTADAAKAIKERENYDSVDFNKLPQGVSLTGKDPKEIAVVVFPPPKEEPQEGNFQRDVAVKPVTPNLTTVIVTETGLLDDSVNGIRDRADFELSEADKLWKMVWVGKQYKCQSGRGSQDWSKQLCS